MIMLKLNLRIYRNTKDGYKPTTKQIFRSREGAEMFINKIIQRSAQFAVLKRKRLKDAIEN
jgi:hypothetical protein